MYNKGFYEDKRAKLQKQSQQILQRLVNVAFDFVSENNDLQERINELNAQEQESMVKDKDKADSKLEEVNQEVKKK